jgi:hypothetical protein
MYKVKTFKWTNEGLVVDTSYWNDQHAAIAYANSQDYKTKVFDHNDHIIRSSGIVPDTYA